MASLSSHPSRVGLAAHLIFGPAAVNNPKLSVIEQINAARPNKGLIGNLVAWLVVAGIGGLSLYLLALPQLALLGFVLCLYFAYAMIVRVITQMNERYDRRAIIRNIREESRFRGLMRVSVGLMSVGFLSLVVALVIAWVDGLGQPSSQFDDVFRTLSPVGFVGASIGFIGSLISSVATIGLLFSAIKIGQRYAQNRRGAYRLLSQFGGKDGILGALGIPASTLEEQNSLSIIDNEVIIDPVPIRARPHFHAIEDNLMKYYLNDLMLSAESTPDRIVLTMADERTRSQRDAYAETNGLLLSLSAEGSSDDEVLGRRLGSTEDKG